MLVVSTCGTSLLANEAPAALRRLLVRHAHLADVEELLEEEREALEGRVEQVEEEMATWTLADAEAGSAELATLLRLAARERADISTWDHWLIGTDTWQSRQAVRLLEKWLLAQGARTVWAVHPAALGVKLDEDTQRGAQQLVGAWHETVPSYLSGRHEVVAAITGGFKPVQALVQTLAAIDGCECVYVFRGHDELLSVPVLPLALDVDGVIDQWGVRLRRVDLGLASVAECEGLPRGWVTMIDDSVLLSDWGMLVWERARAAWYRRGIAASPLRTVSYGPRFLDEAKRVETGRVEQLNLQVDKLCKVLSGQVSRIESLDLRDYKAHPGRMMVDAWSDADGRRIVLRRDGQHTELEDLITKKSQ